jgi:hypothetical protein
MLFNSGSFFSAKLVVLTVLFCLIEVGCLFSLGLFLEALYRTLKKDFYGDEARNFSTASLLASGMLILLGLFFGLIFWMMSPSQESLFTNSGASLNPADFQAKVTETMDRALSYGKIARHLSVVMNSLLYLTLTALWSYLLRITLEIRSSIK